MAVHLLDVNVLLALFDRQHVHHEACQRWFTLHRSDGWATCPITENGFVRISSHPKFPTQPGDAATVSVMLSEFCQDVHHQFWPADVRLADVLKPGVAFSHRHITDVYLLGLAIRKRGRLATLDRRIPSAVIEQGQAAVTLIPV